MDTWHSLYKPAMMQIWQGRQDASADAYFYQLVKPLDLTRPCNVPANSVALLGFECDLGVQRNLGRAGAHAGPIAIKQALARLPVSAPLVIYDAGSICPQDNDLAAAQAALGAAVQHLLAQGIQPIVLGGGHETAWGHYQGIAKFLQQQPLSIINFDAHFDLRDIPEDNIGTSGTPFRQIAQARQQQHLNFDYTCIGVQPYGNTSQLFATAKQLQTQYLLADVIHTEGSHSVEKFIAPILEKSNHIYLSLCLDVFAASIAPGVSAPQVLGLTPWQVIPALRQLALSKKIISFDIVELAPNFDSDQRTAKLAALLICDFLTTRFANKD